jgi:hypothetical protein
VVHEDRGTGNRDAVMANGADVDATRRRETWDWQYSSMRRDAESGSIPRTTVE